MHFSIICILIQINVTVSHFFISYSRAHPKIKNLDMLHAADYSNVGLQQMEWKLMDAKKKDKMVSKDME